MSAYERAIKALDAIAELERNWGPTIDDIKKDIRTLTFTEDQQKAISRMENRLEGMDIWVKELRFGRVGNSVVTEQIYDNVTCLQADLKIIKGEDSE